MRDGLFATSAVLALTNLGVGWYLGYRSIGAHLLFLASAALVALTAVRLVRRVFPAGALSDTLIRVGIVSFAIIVLSGLVLGSAGLLSPRAYLVVFLALLALSRLTSAPSTLPLLNRWPAVPLPIVAVVVPVLAFIVAVGIIESPLTLYDSLSYHLFFPAHWIQEQRLSIVPTPFGDPAQAYQPANGELFFCG